MKWMLGFLSAGVASAVAGYTKISRKEVNQVTGIINDVRRTESALQPPAAAMMKVSWNYGLEQSLNAFIKDTPPAWLWEKNQTAIDAGARYNFEALMKMDPFVSKFPGYDFLFHDGCMNGPEVLRRGMIFRLKTQAHCFNYTACSDTVGKHPGTINTYTSCAQPLVKESNVPCAWSWQYYPKALNENMKSVACILTGTPGANEAGYRPNHYMCYYGPATLQTSEKPYKEGAACSECPPSTKCQEKLCV